MFTKKELITVGIFIVFFSLLVFFLPQIEGFLSHRKDYEYDESMHSRVDRYICTYDQKTATEKTIIESTFYINDNKVTRVYTKESKSYQKKADFDAAYQQALETVSSDIKVTPDDVNYTIYIVKGIDIQKDTKTEYPTEYTKLKKYLKEKGYDCTVRYQK